MMIIFLINQLVFESIKCQKIVRNVDDCISKPTEEAKMSSFVPTNSPQLEKPENVDI